MPPALHIVIVVYGKTYSELLASITLANVAALLREVPAPLQSTTVLRILTTKDDVATIRASSALVHIAGSVQLEIIDAVRLEGFDRFNRYGPMVLAQREAVIHAARVGAALIFVGPDQIFNRGAFRTMVERMRQGYRVVVGPGLRIRRDDVRETLLGHIKRSADGTFALEPADQARLLFGFWHQTNDQYLIGSDTSLWLKSIVTYRPHQQELFVRCFQGPTLMLWPRQSVGDFEGFVDHALINAVCSSWREVYVVSDSVECLALDMSEDSRYEDQPLADFPYVALLRQLFNRHATQDIQLEQGFRTCRIHDGEQPPRLVGKWRREFDRVVDPLILIALAERKIYRKFGGRIAILFRALSQVTAHTLILIVRPWCSHFAAKYRRIEPPDGDASAPAR